MFAAARLPFSLEQNHIPLQDDVSNRALLLAADSGDESWTPEESLAELSRLADTAGISVAGMVVQHLKAPQPRSYLGKGRVQEVREEKSTLRYDTVIADDELSPSQQRYLEAALDVQVLDRTAVILHIFAKHARTREGRLQVELAQYRYRLPRLSGHGVALSRLGAGINTRGPGETKLENDRRRIRRRISELTDDIERVRAQRALHRRQRRASGLPVIALVGYTNAGKSTLMNALTRAGVLSSDRLFATLDPITRRLSLPNGQEVLLTDTVGFIQKLPTDLIAAFRATLEEITEADTVLHVVDGSHAQVEQQAEAVEDELETLGVASKPRILVINKADLLSSGRITAVKRRFSDPLVVSAATGIGIDALLDTVQRTVAAQFVEMTVHLPYNEAELVNLFRSRGVIRDEHHDDTGTVLSGQLPPSLVPTFSRFSQHSKHKN